MANLNGLAGDIIGQTVTVMLNRLDPIATQLEQYRQVLRDLKSGEVKLEQVQLTENGGFDIQPLATRS